MNPAGRYLAEPNFEKDAILYAECQANQIKAAKAVFDSLGHYSRWDIAQLALRREPWEPEFAVNDSSNTQLDLPESELRRISEEFEINVEKLESLLEELRKSRT